MNAFVFSSPAHALKVTACPRALATMSFHGRPSAHAENDATSSMSEQSHDAVRPRVMSWRAVSRDFACGFGSGSSLSRTPTPERLLEHRTQNLFVNTVHANPEPLVALS